MTDVITTEPAKAPNDPQILSTQQLIAIADTALAYDAEPLPVVRPQF